MNELPVSVVGMVWYSLEHFDEIKAMMKDGHGLPAVYSLWRLNAEQLERKVRRDGKRTVRAHLIPDEFRQYCLRHGLDFDAHGRSHFASFVAKESQRDDDGT